MVVIVMTVWFIRGLVLVGLSLLLRVLLVCLGLPPTGWVDEL